MITTLILLVAILFMAYEIGKLVQALERAQLRVDHAKWLIYRDWREAATWLGVCERDIAHTLNQERPDLVEKFDPIDTDDLAIAIQVHSASFPARSWDE